MARIQNEVRDTILAKMTPVTKPTKKSPKKVEVGEVKKQIKK